MTTAGTMVQSGEIERPYGEIPFLHMPERSCLFHDRAQRMRTLASGHSMQDYLRFMADLCEAQQEALNVFPSVPLPSVEQLRLCREYGMPPLPVQDWKRDPAWQLALGQIVSRMKEHANPAAMEILGRLQQSDSDALEALAAPILSGRYEIIDHAAALFVTAALQVYWTHMASALGDRAVGRSEIHNLCPVCASHPGASVVRIGGAEQGLRYLSCSMCQTQWHMVRVKCSNCESTKGISYFMIEGSSGVVKAESCDECGSYLKIMYMDKSPHADPVADDLATLALDLKMSENGIYRSGPLLFLMTAPEGVA